MAEWRFPLPVKGGRGVGVMGVPQGEGVGEGGQSRRVWFGGRVLGMGLVWVV
jgi:hypothetical protein